MAVFPCLIRYCLSLLFALAVASCSGDYRYSHYEPLADGKWERGDTLLFTAGPVGKSGHFTEQIGLRTDSRFPFTELTLVVCQQARPSGFSRTDTLVVRLTDDEGNVLGNGISHYQYLVPLSPATLLAGDTLTVGVCHEMLRTPLLGITDVGFSLE